MIKKLSKMFRYNETEQQKKINELIKIIANRNKPWIGVNIEEILKEDTDSAEFYIYNRGTNSLIYEDTMFDLSWQKPTLFTVDIQHGDNNMIKITSNQSGKSWYLSDPTTSAGIPLPQFDTSTSQSKRSVFTVANDNISTQYCKGISYRISKTNRNGGNLRYLEATNIINDHILSGQTESKYNEWLFISKEQYDIKKTII